jgi:hypothetical protein
MSTHRIEGEKGNIVRGSYCAAAAAACIFLSIHSLDHLTILLHPAPSLYRIKILRDAFTLNVFHNAFKDGLMGYGMIYAQKKK